MAHYQQSGSEARSNKSKRQRPPEDASQPYSPTSPNNFVAYQGFNFNESPPYGSTQQYSDDRYGSQGGNSRQYGGAEPYGQGGQFGRKGSSVDRVYHGRSDRNDGRGQDIYRRPDGLKAYNGEDMPEQQNIIGPERRAYTDFRARGPAGPNHALSNNDLVSPQHTQYQDQDRNQQSRHGGMPNQPVFEDELAEISSSKYNRAEGYQDSQRYNPLPQHYPNNNDTDSAYLNERFVLNSQQQDYGEAYRQEITQESSGHTSDYSYNDTAHSKPGNRPLEKKGDEFQSTKFRKPR